MCVHARGVGARVHRATDPDSVGDRTPPGATHGAAAGGERLKSVAPSLAGVPVESDDPRDVDVVVVHADDVVTALAATAQGRETVLRVTPPFRRRQRARIHVPAESNGPSRVDGRPAGPVDEEATGASDADPVSMTAAAFVDDAAPSFPRAPETEPAPAASSEYDVDEHFERHEDAVVAWRTVIPEHFQATVARDVGNDVVTFDVKYLGP